MTVQIAIRLPERDLEALDAAIARGTFPSRAAAVRAGLERLLREDRERGIAEAYRRAYAGGPKDEQVGTAGLRLGADILAREETGGERRTPE